MSKDPDFIVDRVVAARAREITSLRKKAGKVATHSALQAMQLIRRADHLTQLNKERRGPSLPPREVAMRTESAQRTWFS